MKEQKTPQAVPQKPKIAPELAPVAQDQFMPLLPLIVGGAPLPPDLRRKQALQLQRTAGNRAVQRWLVESPRIQRSAVRRTASAPASVQRAPGDTAEANPLPIFMPWAAGVMPQIQLVRLRAETMLFETFAGHIKTINPDAGLKVTEADQNTLKTEYAKKKAEQDGRTSPADIQEYVNNKEKIYPGRLDGFAFKSQNVVYVNTADSEDNQVVTVAHEMLHMNAAGDWVSVVKADIDEGTTELLTQKACAKMKGTKKAYGPQMGIVQKIIPVVGEGTLINAYFGGGAILKNAVDTIIGKGTFDTLLDRILDPNVFGTFDEKIGKLLDPRHATWLKQKIAEMKTLLEGWVSDDDINRIRQIRGTIDPIDMTQVRQEIYPLVDSLWSDRQKEMMIDILS